MNCSEIIKYYLKNSFYDGLYNLNKPEQAKGVPCQCKKTGLFPCNDFDKDNCKAGYIKHLPPEHEFGWVILPKDKS